MSGLVALSQMNPRFLSQMPTQPWNITSLLILLTLSMSYLLNRSPTCTS